MVREDPRDRLPPAKVPLLVRRENSLGAEVPHIVKATEVFVERPNRGAMLAGCRENDAVGHRERVAEAQSSGVESPLHGEIDDAAALHRCHALNRGPLAGLAEKHLEYRGDRDGWQG